MKKIFCLLMLSFLGTIFSSHALGAEEISIVAEQFVEFMNNQDFTSPFKLFDETMKKTLPPDKLKEVWDSLVEKIGRLKFKGMDRIQKIDEYDAVFVKCRFERGEIDTKVVFDRNKKISGLFFLPPEVKEKSKPPAYAIPERFREAAVEVGTGSWKLPGLLTTPIGSGSFPGLVLVHGSGANDRNESLGPNKPFRDIAQGLATKGIGVLRYDKRTFTWKNKMLENSPRFTVKEEVVDDAVNAVSLLAKTPGIDPKRIFVLGHSLGGMMISRIATADQRIAGFIVMAGGTRPLEDIVVDQIVYLSSLDESTSEENTKEIAAVRSEAKAIKNLTLADKNATAPWLMGALPGYWLDLREFKPTEAVKKIAKPMIIMQGERDYQVTMKDFNNWKTAVGSRTDVKLVSYPLLNHLFMRGEGPCSPEEYLKPGNVAEGVINDIADFILNQSQRLGIKIKNHD